MVRIDRVGTAVVFSLTACFIATARAEESKQNAAPESMMQRVGIEQKLDAQLPLDLTFRDEAGNVVRLGDYFGRKKPVVIAFVYYGCPSLCTMVLNGMNQSFRTIDFDIGKDYEVVTVSFDHNETPALAAQKKASYIREYARPGGGQGWHFLTGDLPAIQKLTQAAGFTYVWDDATQQFAHGSAIMVATPDGKLSRYFYGLEYAPKDLRLGLVEASENKIGRLSDSVILLCFQYNPMTGRYGFAIMRSLQTAGIATVLALGGYIVIKLVRERRNALPPPTGGFPAEPLVPGAKV